MKTQLEKMNNQKLDKEIAIMYATDQADRTNVSGLDQMRHNDEVRLKRALEIYGLYKEGERLSGESLKKLAMIFQHAPTTDGIEKAFELSSAAVKLGYEPAEWLMAASEDRLLMYQGKKQKWGTQFKKDEVGKWYQYPIEDDSISGATDELRKKYRIASAEECIKHFEERDAKLKENK